MSAGLIIIIISVLILVVVFVPMFGEQLKQIAGLDKKLIRKYWQRIENYLHQGEAGLQKAITDADKLLDYVLRKGRFGGDTMAERLKKADSKFSDANGVWRAHNLRNRLLHDNGFKVGLPRAKQALAEFRRALKDLGAL